jgi:hypothetical protein
MENIGTLYDHLVYLRPLEIFYGHLVYFVVIWYIFSVLVFCTKKNLATLGWTVTALLFRTKNCLFNSFHLHRNRVAPFGKQMTRERSAPRQKKSSALLA